MTQYKLIKYFDRYILGLKCLLLGLFVRKSVIAAPKKILIIKLWALGDSVNSLTAIKALSDANPEMKIDILARENNYRIFAGQQCINNIILFERKNIKSVLDLRKKYDLAIDFEPFLNISALLAWFTSKRAIGFDGGVRSTLYDASVKFRKDQHILRTYLDMIGLIDPKIKYHAPNKLVKIKYASTSTRKIAKILKNHDRPLIGFCPSVGKEVKEREWPKEHFKELAKKLDKKLIKYTIILVGNHEDKELCNYIQDDEKNIINLSGRLSIDELFCLLDQLDVFVSNDTGPMHIAAAQGTPTIGLFGPNTPKIWAPVGKKCVSIFHPKPGCPFLDNTSHNLVPHILTEDQKTCMDAISVDEVYYAVTKLLRREK